MICRNAKLSHKSHLTLQHCLTLEWPGTNKAMQRWHSPLVSGTHGRSDWPRTLSKSGQSCNLTHTSKPISWQPAVEPAGASPPDLISGAFNRYHSLSFGLISERRETLQGCRGGVGGGVRGRGGVLDRYSVANRKRRYGWVKKKVPFNKILISGL